MTIQVNNFDYVCMFLCHSRITYISTIVPFRLSTREKGFLAYIRFSVLILVLFFFLKDGFVPYMPSVRRNDAHGTSQKTYTGKQKSAANAAPTGRESQ